MNKINAEFRQRKINRRIEMALDLIETEDTTANELATVDRFDYAK